MGNCIVVVQFDLPQRTEEQAITGGSSTAPTYRGLDRKGLIRKDYLNGENGTGGVYLWENMDAAKAFYSGPWVEGIRDRYGMDPIIRYFETSAITDNVDVMPGVRRLNSPRANVAA